jgi:hypothetical protein
LTTRVAIENQSGLNITPLLIAKHPRNGFKTGGPIKMGPQIVGKAEDCPLLVRGKAVPASNSHFKESAAIGRDFQF